MNLLYLELQWTEKLLSEIEASKIPFNLSQYAQNNKLDIGDLINSISFLKKKCSFIYFEKVKSEIYLLKKEIQNQDFKLTLSDWVQFLKLQHSGQNKKNNPLLKYIYFEESHSLKKIYSFKECKSFVNNKLNTLVDSLHNNVISFNQDSERLNPSLDLIIYLQQLIELTFKDHSKKLVFIYKVQNFEDKKYIVYEDITDQTIKISEVNILNSLEFKHNKKNLIPSYSKFQVIDFISGLQTIYSKEMRIILKIKNDVDIDLNPNFQFFSSPYMTINDQGDKIWAATICESQSFFDWFKTIYSKVEVLGSDELISTYKKYLMA